MAIVWNVQTGEIVQKLFHLYPLPKEWLLGGCNNSHVRDLSLSSNGHHIVTVCDDSVIRVWDLLSQNTMQVVGVVSEALCCTYSPGGSCIAVGDSDGGLQIFEAPVFTVTLQSMCRFAIQCHIKESNYSLDQKLSLFKTLPPALQAFLDYKNLITYGEQEN
ncbi:hypothetical protein LSH36_108g04027 [Paralvinella palmiformis]|uniref:Uncharacterized protein n=1 Tax=Paralvinella palmiformis TaxID=53620 RepID=A0AAD9NBA4_9ANNE|nr:hypothetical protein LSH36_108g04027 [Paralvinella palmiformis]